MDVGLRIFVRSLAADHELNTSTFAARVAAFYATAQYFVAFLLLDHQPQAFMPFVEDLMGGMDVKLALSKHYGLESMDAIQKQFNKFAF